MSKKPGYPNRKSSSRFHELKPAGLLLFFFLCGTKILSQTVHPFSINFESNSFTLTQQSQHKLDSVLGRLSNIPAAYLVEIAGHSDTTGLSFINKALSKSRAAETRQYLESKGFEKDAFKLFAKGALEPIDDNITEEGRTHNRRVSVVIRLNLPDITNIGGVMMQSERFVMPADSGGKFYDTSGTIITIPPNAFVDENGNPVKGNIEFSYTEYRDPTDLILSGLPMSYNSDDDRYYFNSYGMFKLNPTQNGKPVFLKKGSTAGVDFAMNKKPENADIFVYDSIRKKWIKPPSRAHEESRGPICDISRDNRMSKIESPEICVCTMNDCAALKHVINNISRYAGTQQSIYEDFISKDSLRVFETLELLDYSNRECPRLRFKNDSISKLIKLERHTYKTTATNFGRHKAKFTIQCLARKNSEFAPLKTLTWKCFRDSNPDAAEKLSKHKWTYCRVIKNDNRFSILLRDSTTQIVLRDVRVMTKERMSKKEKNVFLEKQFGEYEARRAPYQDWIDEMQELRETWRTDIVACQSNADSLYRKFRLHKKYYSLLCSDSIYCFWKANYSFMGQFEKNLLFTKWLKYFDEHGDDMEARATQVRNGELYISCIRRTKDGKYDLAKLPDKVNEKVDVAKPGTYNISSIVNLSDTVEVYASYTDEKGNSVEPVIIYLTDKSVNTAIRYDGTDKYNPYRFRLSPTTVKALIAFDKKNNTYICQPENMTSIFISGRKLTHTFTLKKLEKLKSKQQLLDLLGYTGSEKK